MRMLLHATALLAAAQAAALSCEPPDPVASFLRAEASPETYGLFVGRMTFDDGLMPPPVRAGAAPPVDPPPVPTRLDGHAMGADGFTAPVSLDLLIDPACAGSWCGSIPSGEAWLLFAREADGAWVLDSGPCGGWAFMDPTPAQVDAVVACALGGACKPAP